MSFEPCADDVFFKRNDVLDPRWGEKVLRVSDSLMKPDSSVEWILRGYPDDEGIGLNGGRLGAAEAPDMIRRFFYKTALSSPSTILWDEGNLGTNLSLEDRHKDARTTLVSHLHEKRRVCTLGGGHDYGFPDAAGFMDVFASEDPLILNFDAHLDVRSLERGLTSGTPFFRLLQEFPKCHFLEIGIQPQCNSENHLKWCHEHGVKVLSLPDILYSKASLIEQVTSLAHLSLSHRPPAMISLDIDCFSHAEAPGCSQSWPTGFTANQFLPFLSQLFQFLDVKVFGIYEVSPSLDQDHRTSKLAAQVLYTLFRGQY